MSQDVILVAGTRFEQQLPSGGWQRVPRMTSIGAVGEQAEAKEKTTLEDRIKKYGSGLRDAPDKNMKGQYVPYQETGDTYFDEYTLQQSFITRCRNEEEFNVRVIWPDGETNGFLYKALGFEFDDSTQEDWKMFTTNGKQNSRMIYATTVSGSATMTTTGGDEQFTVSVVPSTVDATEYEDDVVWSSSDETVATVSETGLVSAVATGTVTITAEVRGVPGTLEVTVS